MNSKEKSTINLHGWKWCKKAILIKQYGDWLWWIGDGIFFQIVYFFFILYVIILISAISYLNSLKRKFEKTEREKKAKECGVAFVFCFMGCRSPIYFWILNFRMIFLLERGFRLLILTIWKYFTTLGDSHFQWTLWHLFSQNGIHHV